jgi:four helix bundle protein
VKDYRELKVWQRSHALTLEVYRLSKGFPREEIFSLTQQMRRASSSVGANIAEGCGRDGDAELKRFLTIALGSACELDYFILLARDLGYLEPNPVDTLAQETLEVRKMLGALIRKLKA